MSMVSFDYIRDMPTLHIVVTENCELCDKGLKSLGYLKNLFTIFNYLPVFFKKEYK